MIGLALCRHRHCKAPKGQIVINLGIVAGLSALLIAQRDGAFLALEGSWQVYLDVIGVFVVVWSLAQSWRSRAVSSAFADIGYPLYVSHIGIVTARVGVFSGWGWSPVFMAVLVDITIVLVARVIHLSVEKPTHQLRHEWARRLFNLARISLSCLAVSVETADQVET
jgi:hypothetical protein